MTDSLIRVYSTQVNTPAGPVFRIVLNGAVHSTERDARAALVAFESIIRAFRMVCSRVHSDSDWLYETDDGEWQTEPLDERDL